MSPNPESMRVLLIGVGTVGEAIARMARDRDWCEAMVLADYDFDRATALQAELGDPERFGAELLPVLARHGLAFRNQPESQVSWLEVNGYARVATTSSPERTGTNP